MKTEHSWFCYIFGFHIIVEIYSKLRQKATWRIKMHC